MVLFLVAIVFFSIPMKTDGTKLKSYCVAKGKGTIKELVQFLGCHPSFVSAMLRNERRIPARFCIEIEKFTNGEVKCEDLCPDIDWAYLRNSATGDLSK